MVHGKKKLIILFVIFGLITIVVLYKQELKPLLTPQYISALSGIGGLLIGVLLSELYRKISDRNKRRRELISECSELIHRFLSYVKRIELAHKQDDKAALDSLQGEYYSFMGEVNNLNCKACDIYSNIWIRTATNRLVHSFKTIIEELFAEKSVIPRIHFICRYWITKQMEYLQDLLMKGAGISRASIGRKSFNTENIEELKFEVTPPWKPTVEVMDYKEKNICEETRKKIIKNNLSKIETLRCQKHGYAPHILFRTINMKLVDISVVGFCCEELAITTKTKLENE